MPTNVAIFPMKAHSARVPDKNFRELAGKPLYRWMLDKLLSMSLIDKIVINTDAEQILNNKDLVSNDRVVLRSRKQSLRGDEVSMNRIIEDDMEAVPADMYLMTHTTNPILSVQTMETAIETLRGDSAHDSLFGVNRFQTRFYRENGEPINHDPNNLIPTQDLEPWYEENSNLYLFSAESFAKTRARIGATPLLFVVPKIESTDIDDEQDWLMAEAVALYMQRNERLENS